MTSPEEMRPAEIAPRQENLEITPQSLVEDNHSPLADHRRDEFRELGRKGLLIGVDRCSDARVIPPSNSVSIGTISAAESPVPKLASDRSIQAWLSLTHFDGEAVEIGKMPTGCGGLDAKAKIGNGHHEKGIESYVENDISSPDPLIQSLITAEEIAASSDRPVLAAAQNHLDGTIYPIALFQKINGQMTNTSAVRIGDIRNYNPERVYGEGFPSISEDSLPDVFLQLLESNKSDVQARLAAYPDLKEMLKVQKPRMIMLSTDIRSARVRYPTLSAIPGSIFKVHVPRKKVEGFVKIDEEALQTSLNQLEYPISHAVENHEKDYMPFSSTDRLLIETADFELSQRLAQQALENEWMREWASLPRRKIIVIQTVGGVVSKADEFNPNMHMYL